MKGRPFNLAEVEAKFGPECVALKAREAREAPRFTQEQILQGRAIFATFRVPPPEPEEGRPDAEEE
ncbi:hypothetical protein [Streptomyces sp. NPDC058108]|uniref:hypothetical protein n=1 Tax=Streptomyces sp. NPDC058108 TaxID=3346344 RepID=UPI0036E21AA2